VKNETNLNKDELVAYEFAALHKEINDQEALSIGLINEITQLKKELFTLRRELDLARRLGWSKRHTPPSQGGTCY